MVMAAIGIETYSSGMRIRELTILLKEGIQKLSLVNAECSAVKYLIVEVMVVKWTSPGNRNNHARWNSPAGLNNPRTASLSSAGLNNLNSLVSRNNGGLSPVATNPNHRDASLNAGMIIAVEAAVVIMVMAEVMAAEEDKIDSYTIN